MEPELNFTVITSSKFDMNLEDYKKIMCKYSKPLRELSASLAAHGYDVLEYFGIADDNTDDYYSYWLFFSCPYVHKDIKMRKTFYHNIHDYAAKNPRTITSREIGLPNSVNFEIEESILKCIK